MWYKLRILSARGFFNCESYEKIKTDIPTLVYIRTQTVSRFMGRRRRIRKQRRRQKRSRVRCFPKNSKERGILNEQRFLDALKGPLENAPQWLVHVRESTREEDSRGIDAVVSTRDVGEIHIQIKSSDMGKEKFVKRQEAGRVNPNIIVIVIRDEHSAEEIRATLYLLAGEKRDQFLRMRK